MKRYWWNRSAEREEIVFKIYLEDKTASELDGHLAVGFQRNRGDKGDSKDPSLCNQVHKYIIFWDKENYKGNIFGMKIMNSVLAC